MEQQLLLLVGSFQRRGKSGQACKLTVYLKVNSHQIFYLKGEKGIEKTVRLAQRALRLESRLRFLSRLYH